MLDAAHIDNSRTLVATLRSDLSQGQINLVTMRGAEMSTWRIRPGHDDHFAEAFKTYMGAAKRAGVTPAMATYQVVAGAPAGTYISFSAKRSMADYDKDMKESEMIGRSFTAEEGASLNKFLADGTASLEMNRFHVDPNISLVGDDMIKADPAFWTPSWKKAMPAKAAKP